MQYRQPFIKLALFTLLLLASVLVKAEQYKQLGQYQVHYMALPSTFVKPEIAQQHQIKRSKYNGLINISVLDTKKQNKAVEATLTGVGKNLLGQSTTLNFKQVKGGEAVYYLADYTFSNEEIVNFTIAIKIGSSHHTLNFQHKFYVE